MAATLTVWSVLVSVALPIVCAWGFIEYEKQQDKNKDTESYLDIYEWDVALYINVAILIFWKVLL